MARWRMARSITLAHILLWAGTASGATLALSNFQMISSLSVPLSCILAYNTPIQGCSLRDFTSKSCSPQCQQSLADAQYNIQASCDLVNLGPDTLLGQAQRGNLVNAICGSGDDGKTIITTVTRTPPPPSTPPPPPRTTLRSLTIIPPAPTTAPASATSTRGITSVKSITGTTGTVGLTSAISTSRPDQTSESATPSTRSAASTTESASTLRIVPTASTQPSAAEDSSSSTKSSTTADQPRQTLLPGSGGGSPFDFVAASASTTTRGVSKMHVVVACVLGLLLAA